MLTVLAVISCALVIVLTAAVLGGDWSGHPVELGDAWRLHKRDGEARCQLWSHECGFELRVKHGM